MQPPPGSCMAVLAARASALTQHRQPPSHNFTTHTDPMRHLIHIDHTCEALCCSPLKALCLTAHAASISLMLRTYTVPQIHRGGLQMQEAWSKVVKGCMMVSSVSPSVIRFKGSKVNFLSELSFKLFKLTILFLSETFLLTVRLNATSNWWQKVYFLNTFLKDISSESVYLPTSAPLDLINSSTLVQFLH